MDCAALRSFALDGVVVLADEYVLESGLVISVMVKSEGRLTVGEGGVEAGVFMESVEEIELFLSSASSSSSSLLLSPCPVERGV
jgi:hypothetical protein